jgi:hypothetical protein
LCSSCVPCCQFLWIVHFWLPLQCSLTFIYKFNIHVLISSKTLNCSCLSKNTFLTLKDLSSKFIYWIYIMHQTTTTLYIRSGNHHTTTLENLWYYCRMFVKAKLLTSVLIDDIFYFKHIVLSYKTKQMDKTQEKYNACSTELL